MKLVKKNNFFLLFIIMLFSFGFNGISVKAEGEHQFSLKAYDWNAFDNNWEGSGTGEEISNNGTIEPGKVYKLSIYYIPGTITEVGMQMGIKYNNLLIEPMYAEGELYTETDMSTTYQGGIWPASGTTPSAKKKTNWQVLSNDASDESMFTFMATDTTTSKALETEGEIASVYFKVKDTVTSGTNIIFEYDDEYTALNNDRPKVTSGINLTVQTALSSNSALHTLSVTNSEITYNLTPTFTADDNTIKEYSTVVPSSVTSVDLSATATDSNASVLSGGLGIKELNIGNNDFNIVVTAGDGSITAYKVSVYRLNDDATLKSLDLTNNVDIGEFNSVTTEYETSVPYATKNTVVSATTTDQNASIKSGTGSFEFTNYGTTPNTKEIIVNAENCKEEYASVPNNACTTKTYTVTVNRENPSNNNYLSNLKVNGQTVTDFNKEKLEYTLDDVKGDVSSIEVSAITEDTKASVVGTGNKSLSIGDNSIEVVVTAEDGSTKTYTIKVKKLSNDIALKSLTVTSDPMGTLTPTFASTTYAYTYNYDATVTSLNVTATTNNTNAKVGIIDSDSSDIMTSTIGSATKTFTSTTKNVKVTVIAEDESTKDYTITLSRALSNNSYLKDISIDGTNIDGFNKENFEYNIKVSRETNSINISAILDDEKATLTTDLSNKFSLNLGTNKINIVVTAENGDTSTYVLNIEREKNNDATLDSLTVSKGILTPTFNKNTLNYTVNVENDVTSIEVSATATDSNATVTGIGTKELNTGNNLINIVVKSESGSENTYTINVIRAKSSNNNLTDIKVDGNSIENFSSNTLKYNLPKVSYNRTSINVEAILSDSKASVTGVGNVSLNTGDNKIEIIVTAEDGTAKTYELNIEREKNNNAKLQSLSIGNYTLTPAFNKDTLEYTVTVGEDVNILNQDDVIAIPEDNNATVVKQGNLELSTTSDNYYRVTVTAENGVDKNVYAIKVIRPKSSDATLKSLEIIGGKLTPTFNKDTLEYNVTMGKDVTKFNKDNIKVSINNGNAKISYNNEIIINSDTFTKYIITVTAENGSKKEYILNVKVDTELDKITSSSHTINDEYIKTVRLYETGRELKDELDNDNAYLEIWTSDESRKVEDDEKLSTGMIVKLVINGVEKDRKIIVIRGDTSGDGEIDLLDAVKILNNALQKAMLDGAYKEAAFVNNDDEIDLLDAVMILNHCLQKQPLY